MDDNAESSNGSGTTLYGEENNNDGTLTGGPTWSTDFQGRFQLYLLPILWMMKLIPLMIQI